MLIILPKLYKLGKSDQLWDKNQQDETRQISKRGLMKVRLVNEASQKHEINQFNIAQKGAFSLMLENILQCYYRRGKEVDQSL